MPAQRSPRAPPPTGTTRTATRPPSKTPAATPPPRAYNADDKPTLVTDPDGNATLTCYDGDGNTAQTVPPRRRGGGQPHPGVLPGRLPGRVRHPAGLRRHHLHLRRRRREDRDDHPGAGRADRVRDHHATPTTATGTWSRPPPRRPRPAAPSQVTADTYNAAGQLVVADHRVRHHGRGRHGQLLLRPERRQDRRSSTPTATPPALRSARRPRRGWSVRPPTRPRRPTRPPTATTRPASWSPPPRPRPAAAPAGATTTSPTTRPGNKLTSTDPNGVTTTWTYTPLDQQRHGQLLRILGPLGQLHLRRQRQPDRHDRCHRDLQLRLRPVRRAHLGARTAPARPSATATTPTGTTRASPTRCPPPRPGPPPATVGYGYDHADLLTSVTDFNGPTDRASPTPPTACPAPKPSARPATPSATTYDPADAPSAITLKNSSTTLQSFTYSDAPAGTILSETDTPSSPQSPAAYTYDAQGRVTSDDPRQRLGQRATASTPPATSPPCPPAPPATYDKAGELTYLGPVRHHHQLHLQRRRRSGSPPAQGSTTASAAPGTAPGSSPPTPTAAANMTAATYDGNGLRATATITPTGRSATTQNYVLGRRRGYPGADHGLRQRLHLRRRRDARRAGQPRHRRRHLPDHRLPRLGPRHRQLHRRPDRRDQSTTPGATRRPPAASPPPPRSATPAATPTRPACSTSSTATTTPPPASSSPSTPTSATPSSPTATLGEPRQQHRPHRAH